MSQDMLIIKDLVSLNADQFLFFNEDIISNLVDSDSWDSLY
jgi:hypothetical protein